MSARHSRSMQGVMRHQGGFSLIEIMVVVVIMGVLAAVVLPNLLDRPNQARATAAGSDVGSIMQALKLYRLDNDQYPSGDQGLRALAEKPTAGHPPPNWRSYLDRLLVRGRKIILRKIGTGTDDRRKSLRAAAARVRKSLDEPFRQMDSKDIMAFLRPDDDDGA